MCNNCDELKETITATTNPTEKRNASIKINLHVRESKKAQDEIKSGTISTEVLGSGVSLFCMQQVLFVPTITHSKMFYTHLLSQYNPCIHETTNSDSYMNIWNESISSQAKN